MGRHRKLPRGKNKPAWRGEDLEAAYRADGDFAHVAVALELARLKGDEPPEWATRAVLDERVRRAAKYWQPDDMWELAEFNLQKLAHGLNDNQAADVVAKMALERHRCGDVASVKRDILRKVKEAHGPVIPKIGKRDRSKATKPDIPAFKVTIKPGTPRMKVYNGPYGGPKVIEGTEGEVTLDLPDGLED